jgi:hypothetical protein
MRHGRWIAAVTGLAAAAVLVAPAAAGVKAAATDKAILSAGVLAAADAPQGWTASKQTDSGTKPFKGVSACKGIATAVTNAKKSSAKALSPQFTDPANPNTTLAENSVYAFKTAKAATTNLAAYQDSSTQPCLEAMFNKQLTGQAQATVAPITDQLQGVGDAAAGYEATIVVNNNGQPVTLIADSIAVRVGRAFLSFSFLNSGTRISQGPAIVNAVVDRVKTTIG